MTGNEEKIKAHIEEHLEDCRATLKKFENEARDLKNPRHERAAVMVDAWVLHEADLMILRLEFLQVVDPR